MKNKELKLRSIDTDKYHFEFRVPRKFQMIWDEEADSWLIEDKELHIYAMGSNEARLLKALREEIERLWEEYVLVDATGLSPASLELREDLYRNMEGTEI